MGKIIDLNRPPRRDDSTLPAPRRRLPNGAGRRSPRVQLRVPLTSLAETEQHLDTLLHALEQGQKYLRRAKRTGEHADAMELVRRVFERANRLMNAKRVPIDREETQ